MIAKKSPKKKSAKKRNRLTPPKRRGAPKKDSLAKKVRGDYSMDRTVLAILNTCKEYGFKDKSAMVNASVISMARQHQAKVFETNLLANQHGM